MSNDQPDPMFFESSKKALEYLKAKADDIDCITISVARGMLFSSPEGVDRLFRGAAGHISTSDGQGLLLNREHLEELLNDGLLNRLRVRVHLLPLESD